MTDNNSKTEPRAAAAAVRGCRYCIVDGLRGLAILNMLAYHTLWDLVYIFGVELPWYRAEAAYIWQQYICWTFIFLSGFCYPMGKRKLKRGVQVFALGLLITAVTWIAVPESVIVFGVLTLIGSCMLLLYPIEKFMRKMEPAAGFAVCMLLFVLTRNLNRGYLGFEALNLIKLPETLYSSYASAFLGFPPPEFSSSDYFSLFPWIFMFAAGYFLNGFLQKRRWLTYLHAHTSSVLEYIGCHTLPIYIAHQPVIYLVCMLTVSGGCLPA